MLKEIAAPEIQTLHLLMQNNPSLLQTILLKENCIPLIKTLVSKAKSQKECFQMSLQLIKGAVESNCKKDLSQPFAQIIQQLKNYKHAIWMPQLDLILDIRTKLGGTSSKQSVDVPLIQSLLSVEGNLELLNEALLIALEFVKNSPEKRNYQDDIFKMFQKLFSRLYKNGSLKDFHQVGELLLIY